MSIPDVILFLTLAFASSFLQRVTGFGFGILLMTGLPYLAPSYAEATAISGMLAIVNNVFPALKYRNLTFGNGGQGRPGGYKLLIITPVCLLFAFLAIKFVGASDSRTLKDILGAMLIALSVYFLFINGRIRIKPTPAAQAGMGALSGTMGGLFSMQGPPAVIYFLASSDSKEEYIGLTQTYFLISNLAMLLFRALNGMITRDVLIMSVVGIPAVLAGLHFGAKVFGRINADSLKKAIYVFLAVAGLAAIIF